MSHYPIRIAGMGLCCLLAAASCNRATDVATGGGATPEMTAESLLRKTTDFYRELDSFRVDVVQTTEISFQGQEQKSTSEFHTTAQRPNLMAIHDTTHENIGIVSDGERVYTSIAEMKKYASVDAPATFDELLQSEASGTLMLTGMGTGFVLNLLRDDAYSDMMQGIEKSTLAPDESIDGVLTHHLQFEQANAKWDAWLAAEGDPVVVKIVFDLSPQFAASGIVNAKSINTFEFNGWSVNPKLKEETFVFQPAPDFEEAEGLFDSGGREPEPSPLIGKPAPELVSTTLAGEPFKLSEQHAENIVLLDFWATWCGPCVQEMPVLAEVAKEYKKRGVRLFAVNQGEDAETIAAFLRDKEMDVNVVMDAKGDVSSGYQVQGIPMLVIVDKGGNVHNVHIGYRPDIGDALRRELDELLSDDGSE
ncbi:MAG: DUF2092 domain-containing protein [Pirellulaceae bacterium]|nr:DUF2092 domain-containing protein [Pirellulaceae bacterium]MDP7019720.1 DUF2092 domain-containing protein [Pirellulaceae bacterium]